MSGTRAEIPFDLIVNNTLFVSTNGDNASAEVGNWNLPFATITEASNQASAGDTIYVFAGTYNEGSNDIIKSDVQYHFEDGALVQCNFRVISDFGVAKNIYVTGHGTFQVLATNFTYGVVGTDNPASTLYFRGKEMIGVTNGLNINNGASFDVKCDTISATTQYAVNIRGNVEGVLEFGTINGAPSSVPIIMRNLGTDLVERQIVVRGNFVNSSADAFAQASVTHINCNDTRFIYENFTINHTAGTSGGLYYTLSGGGNTLIRNVYGVSAVGYGCLVQTNAELQLSGCDLKAEDYAIVVNGNGCVFARDSWLKVVNDNAGSGGAVACSGSGQIDLDNCVVEMETIQATRKTINVVNDFFRARNCKFLASNVQTESVGTSSGVNRNILIEGYCSTNRPVSALITNIVAGTNIIVDSNVGKNLRTFL